MSEEFDDISQEEIDKLLKILDEIPDDKENIDYDFIRTARKSIKLADALLKELDKKEEQ